MADLKRQIDRVGASGQKVGYLQAVSDVFTIVTESTIDLVAKVILLEDLGKKRDAFLQEQDAILAVAND